MIDNTPLLDAIDSAKRDNMRKAHGIAPIAALNLAETAWRDAHFHFETIRNFNGIKAFLPIPAFTLLETTFEQSTLLTNTIRHLLAVFDSVVLVPSPSSISCHRYCVNELNYSGMSIRNAYIPRPFIYNAFEILCNQPDLVKCGALTALPLLGESPSRWEHPALDLPRLSTPYSMQLDSNLELAEREDFLNLVTERLVAERLGCIHVNAFSFDSPFMGDMTLPSKPSVGRAIMAVKIPHIDAISLTELGVLRKGRELERRAFAKHILDSLRSDPANTESVSAELAAHSERLWQEYNILLKSSKTLTEQLLVKSIIYAFSATGALGSASSAAAFLAGGGVLYDLRKLLTEWQSYRVKARSESLFFLQEIRNK